jgi:hypothetical protein
MYFLLLDDNLFNDDDGVLLAEALKMNTTLEWINLESNQFTTVGIKALIKSIYDCSSLNAISESNHTLRDRIYLMALPLNIKATCLRLNHVLGLLDFVLRDY